EEGLRIERVNGGAAEGVGAGEGAGSIRGAVLAIGPPAEDEPAVGVVGRQALAEVQGRTQDELLVASAEAVSFRQGHGRFAAGQDAGGWSDGDAVSKDAADDARQGDGRMACLPFEE